MTSFKVPQMIPDDIDPELAVQRLAQACMQAHLHITCPDFFRIVSIQNPHECFQELCQVVNTSRLDVQKIIRTVKDKIK